MIDRDGKTLVELAPTSTINEGDTMGRLARIKAMSRRRRKIAIRRFIEKNIQDLVGKPIRAEITEAIVTVIIRVKPPEQRQES